MIKNITTNYSVIIFFIYDAVFFSYDTIFFIYDASFFSYDASFFLYDAIFFIYDTVYFCLVMIFFLLDTAFFSFFAISVHFIAIHGILSIIHTTHNAKFPHRNIIRWGNLERCFAIGVSFCTHYIKFSMNISFLNP